jgi:hypothetical protein
MTMTKIVALVLVTIVTGLDTSPVWVVVGLAVDAVSHYWADRRTTLEKLAGIIPGKAKFYQLGKPRPDHDDNFCLGTGAYALDQSFHIGFLFIAALIISV